MPSGVNRISAKLLTMTTDQPPVPNRDAAIVAHDGWQYQLPPGGDALARPVLLTVPHAGRDYPAPLLAQARVDATVLRLLEDRFVDALVRPLVIQGYAAMLATRARAYIDLNRAPDDLDRSMIAGLWNGPVQPGAGTRGGLGLFPRRLAGHGELWRGPMDAADAAARIATLHRPWHDCIGSTLAAMHDRHGFAVLIDIHSMPSLPRNRTGPTPTIVLGDGRGRTAADVMVHAAAAELSAHGLTVGRNQPYAGGYTIRHHADPSRHIYAIQIEWDRALYLDADGRVVDAAVARLSAALHSMAMAMERLAATMAVRGLAAE